MRNKKEVEEIQRGLRNQRREVFCHRVCVNPSHSEAYVKAGLALFPLIRQLILYRGRARRDGQHCGSEELRAVKLLSHNSIIS